MNTDSIAKNIPLNIKVPLELNDWLKAEAKANKRSRHQQILFLLEIFFNNSRAKQEEKSK